MTWINTVSYDNAIGKLKLLYDRIKGPDNNIDNIMQVHSLRPHTMEAHMMMYKYILHHPHNTLPKWFLELIGVYTSWINGCFYCVDHHFAGMKRLIQNDEVAERYIAAIKKNELQQVFSVKEMIVFEYISLLTLNSKEISEKIILSLKEQGWLDGEILEINQVTAYFNYANRTVLGLGVNTHGDILGLSPNNSEDLNNWQHQ